MPFAGDAEAARRAIGFLERLRTGPGDELILADNSPEGVARREAEGGRVTIVPAVAERSSYHARNAGAEAAANDWLLFLDADCLPDPALLDLHLAPPPGAGVGVIAGGVRPAAGQEGVIPRYARARTHITEGPQVRSAPRPAGITPNLMLRREAYEAVGGFHEGLGSGADVEICWRIQDAGWGFEHRPEAAVEHHHVESLGALGRQCRRHAAGRAWLNRRYPGAAPRPKLTRRLVHALGGAVYRAVRLQGERALFRAIDSWWFCQDSAGYLLGNRAGREERGESASAQRTPVAFVCDAFPAVSETFVAAEARALERLGHRVRVESGRRPERPDPEARRAVPSTQLEDDGIAYKLWSALLLCIGHPRGCLRDARDRRRWAREEGIWPLRSLAPAARRIERSGDRHLHAHFAETAALNALRLGRILGLPYSVTAHAYDIFKDPRNLPEKLREATFATTGCEYNVRHLRELAPDAAERIHEVVMGVDGDRFRRSRDHPGGRHVVAIGRLVEKKGFAQLVEAAALLSEREPLEWVTIVGDGPLRGELAARISRLGLEDTVRLAGWRDPEAVRELLEEADLLAVPCVVAADGDRDSMPVVAKEALAMEVPVVASDEVGLPELVRPEWGRLVRPGDAEALAAAIAELLAMDPDERRRMGRAGREFVLGHADVTAETRRLSDLIEAAQR
jgi:colanic acid/amylovoran biosynthesis glycosyltransferase